MGPFSGLKQHQTIFLTHPRTTHFWTQPTSKHFPDSINVQAFSGLNQRPTIFRTQLTSKHLRTQLTSKHFPDSTNVQSFSGLFQHQPTFRTRPRSNNLPGLNPGYTDSEVVFDLVSDVGGWSKISARKTLHMKCRHTSTSFSSRRSQ